MDTSSTIVAVSTPPGRGGIGVVRLSGSQARRIAESILKFPKTPEWRPWSAQMATLPDGGGEPVDQVVVTFFERPRSYTAEDVIEIGCHGSPVVLRCAVERAVAAGARPAEPGEFTLRAFLNGRIDLPRAEAVRDLIEATTLYQARVAARQLEGSLSRRLAPIKEQLLELIALLEAGIDFADDDVTVAGTEEILARLDPVRDAAGRLAASFAYGGLVHAGLNLAIVGRPNVGKSSLFNRLLEEERAIVTPIPGTTRDVVSETASIRGIPVKLFDTAGIREGGETVEVLGIERSYQAMADADVTLVVVDVSEPLGDEDYALIERARSQGRWLLVGNKCDLAATFATANTLSEPRPSGSGGAYHVSALTGEGIDALRDALLPPEEDPGFLTSIRHEHLLRESLAYLDKAREAIAMPHEMLLLDLYAALQPLDALTGATTADDILNRIFNTFCIGK